METNTLMPIARSSSDWVSAPVLRTLLKSNLGLNARQVSVARKSSEQYLVITIRDAGVDVAAVNAFAHSLHTWTMDNTDYVSGQSIHVVTTSEVNAVHAAPFVEEIKRAVAELQTRGSWTELSNGKQLNVGSQGYWVTHESRRGCYVWPADVISGKEWAIQALALQMARV